MRNKKVPPAYEAIVKEYKSQQGKSKSGIIVATQVEQDV